MRTGIVLCLVSCVIAVAACDARDIPASVTGEQGVPVAPGPREPAKETFGITLPATLPSAAEFYAVERALGARCPEPDEIDVSRKPCRGPVPAHLASTLVALPTRDVYFPRSMREASARKALQYYAVPGLGRRPDFWLPLADGAWLRSFEGPDPAITVYLFRPPSPRPDSAIVIWHAAHPEDPEPSAEPPPWTDYAFKVYRTVDDGTPQDVTSQLLPPKPTMTAEERRRYGLHLGYNLMDASDDDIFLVLDKLQYAPTMRWIMEFDPDNPIPESDPRRFGDWANAHFGFLVWTGKRFELRQTVPRSRWPCRPVPRGVEPCSYFPDAGFDSFVKLEH
ncbi:hypothetical protein ACFONC_15040 [Luteimonas soli]|uniref:Uncharacterized protein n=1 Tax=Luteimonas soli TaxID=1648966 RepID=A0ABV7XMR4_9GAMM